MADFVYIQVARMGKRIKDQNDRKTVVWLNSYFNRLPWTEHIWLNGVSFYAVEESELSKKEKEISAR